MRHHLSILGPFLFLIPVFVHAAALVNINTADAATLESLPHIGVATAQKIIDYRMANGPFQTIEDIRKASTYINPTYYADIAPLITVGGTTSASTQDASSPAAVATSTMPQDAPSPAVVSRALPELTVQVRGSGAATLEVPVTFSAVVKGRGGAVDSAASIEWSFGDGSSGQGSSVSKTYRYAGTYLVVATASDDSASAQGELSVTAAPSAASIALVSDEGITIANDSSERLDLSLWRLTSSTGIFRIPVGTVLLPHASVLFPFAITRLPIAFDAALTYPSGVLAAQYAPSVVAAAAPEQPAVATTSYSQVQEVEPIKSTKGSVRSYEEAVNAPAATTELAAAGAVPAPTSTPALPSRAGELLRSPWTYGLFGIMLTAAGAFILL